MGQFRTWADEQVHLWGLDRSNASDADSLLTAAVQAVKSESFEEARRAVGHYAARRPVDPWPMKALVHLSFKHGKVGTVFGPLEQLDRIEFHSGHWSVELTNLHRFANRFEQAGSAIQRPLYREPYNTTYRELAAAIELQRGNPQEALRHINAMTILEPHEPIQWTRLAAIYRRIGSKEKMKQAAKRALELDKDAPVTRFLKTFD